MPTMLTAAGPFLSLLIAATALAQRPPLRNFTTADGLVHNLVNRIYPDSRGFIWFCTREGLSRFDGHEFVNYGVREGLPSGVVNDIVEGAGGIYWLATARGLVRFDPGGVARTGPRDTGSIFVTYSPGSDEDSRSVTTLHRDDTGTLWIGTLSGLYRVEESVSAPGQFSPVSVIREIEVTAIAKGPDRSLWVGSSKGVYVQDAVGVFQHLTVQPLDAFVTTVLVDDGGAWIGTTTTGLHRIVLDDQKQRLAQRYSFGPSEGLPSTWVQQVSRASSGGIWVVTTGGLARLEPGHRALHPYDMGRAMAGVQTLSLVEDDRSVWIGTSRGAVAVEPVGVSIFDSESGIPNGGAIFATDQHGVFVMGADNDWRMHQLGGSGVATVTIPLARTQATWGWNQVTLLDRAGDWWTGTRKGLLRYRGVTRPQDLQTRPPSQVYGRATGLPNDVVLRLFEDSQGNIWVSTVGEGQRPNGLSRWHRAENTWTHMSAADGFPPLDRFYASSFAETAGGDVWVGFSGGGGLARFRVNRARTFGEEDGVPRGAVRNLLVDGRGHLWAASYRSGLLRIEHPEANEPRLRVWNSMTGLSSNEVTALVDDRSGRIYAGTGRGINRLDPSSGQITVFTTELLGEFQGAVRDAEGALWFSCSRGVIRYRPDEERARPIPQTYITAMRLAGQPQPLSALGDSRPVELRFAAQTGLLDIEFVAPRGAWADEQYQLRLDGVDHNWSPLSRRRSVTYGNLGAGRYRFLVRAVGADGTVGEPAAVSFTIVPPVWRRWWFLGSVTMAVGLSVFAAVRRQSRRRQAIASIRARIASDLHDDIGANLTRIAVLSEVVRQRGVTDSQADQFLASMGRVARESITAMSDIIWAIKPERDDLGELGRKMREYGEEMCTAADIHFQVELPTLHTATRLPPDLRRDIYLVFKEAITNAVKHAGCTTISAAMRKERGRLILEITENGRGFDPSAPAAGHGLVNMRQRAARLGGVIEVTSRPGEGTRIRLELPLEHRRSYLLG